MSPMKLLKNLAIIMASIVQLLKLVSFFGLKLEGYFVDDPLEELNEGIIQLCTWEQSDANKTQYFKYLQAFSKNCIDPDESSILDLRTCSDSILEDLQTYDQSIMTRVKECFSRSFIGNKNRIEARNRILDRYSSQTSGIYSVPGIIINKHFVRVFFFVNLI